MSYRRIKALIYAWSKNPKYARLVKLLRRLLLGV